MTDTVQGESLEAATTAAPVESVDTETAIQPGAESAPAKVDPLDPEFSSEIENVQKKFNKLTETRRSEERARLRAEEERDYWRQQAISQQAKPEPEKPAVEAKPKALSDFEYDEGKYHAYLLEQAEIRATQVAERKLKEAQVQETTARRQADFTIREREFAKSQADYFDVTRADGLRITQSMVDAAADSEEAPAVLYYLGKNREIAERISRLSPLDAARELGKIEGRLVTERANAKVKLVSQAPAPTPKIEAGNVAGTKDPSEMTDAEYAKWRRRQIAQRR